MIYIKLVILSVALYILLRSLSSLFSALPLDSKIRKALLRLYPLFEMIIWISFALWTFYSLFHDSAVYPLLSGAIVIVLVAIFGWYMVRDYISGVIIKTENNFEPGQYVTVGSYSGKIVKLGYRSLELETRNGEVLIIPYSKLSHQNLIKIVGKSKGAGQVITLEISSVYQTGKVHNMLEKRILEMPWILPGKDIDIKIFRKDENINIVEINFHALTREMVFKTEENLKIFVDEVFGGK